MSENKQNLIPVGTEPTEEHKFFISWGRESLKNNLQLVNEVLRQLVTLNSVLLGGSIAFLDEKLIASSFKKGVTVAFFLSLIVSFLGMMPYEGKVDRRIAERIKQHKEKAFKCKRIYLWVAGALLCVGFGLALAGMITR